MHHFHACWYEALIRHIYPLICQIHVRVTVVVVHLVGLHVKLATLLIDWDTSRLAQVVHREEISCGLSLARIDARAGPTLVG